MAFKRVLEEDPWIKQHGPSLRALSFNKQLGDLDKKETGWDGHKNKKCKVKKEEGWEKDFWSENGGV